MIKRINIEFGRSADTLHDQFKAAGYTVKAPARQQLADMQSAANNITWLRSHEFLTKRETDSARARLERKINKLPRQVA